MDPPLVDDGECPCWKIPKQSVNKMLKQVQHDMVQDKVRDDKGRGNDRYVDSLITFGHRFAPFQWDCRVANAPRNDV